MKNIFVPKSLSSQNRLNCGNVGFCAKLATGKYLFAEAGFGVQDSTQFELFTRNMDDSGLPALLLVVPGTVQNTRGTASHKHIHSPENTHLSKE